MGKARIRSAGTWLVATLAGALACGESGDDAGGAAGTAGSASGRAGMGPSGNGGASAAAGGAPSKAGAGGVVGASGAGSAGTAATGGSASASGGAGGGGAQGGGNTGGSSDTGGSATGGVSSGGAGASGASASGGVSGKGGSGAMGGTSGTGGSGSIPDYPCDGTTDGYDAVMTKSGSTWTVVNGSERYSGPDMQAALIAAYDSLDSGRTTKQSILVQGDGDIPASAHVCGTLNVSGTPSGSDRSPLYARGKTDIEIPNLKMTGSPQYGIFIRDSDNVHLGQIELRLTASAGIGIRADSGGSASTMTTFSNNFSIDYVYGSGMGSHIVETYGVDGVNIGTVEGEDVGESGLLLNRSINVEVGLVSCTDCATGTGYAAFRVANDVGKVGNTYPTGNIHVRKVIARGGGRGIFSVSGCGGLVIDEIDIADTGNTSILLQNTYNSTIAAVSGTVVGGVVQISNDTDNTESGRYAPSEDVTISNLVLSGGASVRQDWCAQYGANGCTATNVTGGNVSMCP
jgi:hypothetical protein